MVHDSKDNRPVTHALAVGHLRVSNGIGGEQVAAEPASVGRPQALRSRVGSGRCAAHPEDCADELQGPRGLPASPARSELLIPRLLRSCSPSARPVSPSGYTFSRYRHTTWPGMKGCEAACLQMSCHALVCTYHHPATLGSCSPWKSLPSYCCTHWSTSIPSPGECGPEHASLGLFMCARVLDLMNDGEGSLFEGGLDTTMIDSQAQFLGRESWPSWFR